MKILSLLKGKNGITSILSAFGFNPDSFIPTAEKELVKGMKSMQQKVGQNLVYTAMINPEDENEILISVYTSPPDNPEALQHYKTFPFSHISEFLKNLENAENNESSPEQAAQPGEEAATGDTDGTDTANAE